MTVNLQITSSQSIGLAALKNMGQDNIEKLIELIEGQEIKSFFPDTLVEHYEENFELPDGDLERVFNQLYMVYRFSKEDEIEPDEFFEGLTHGLIKSNDDNWNEKEISNWKKLRPQIIKLFSLPMLRTVFKATELTTGYDNVLGSAMILTDIRPVFNDDASEVEGSLINCSLRLKYYDKNRDMERLSIALDTDDIKKLMAYCERALKKTKTAKKFLLSCDTKPTFILGEK